MRVLMAFLALFLVSADAYCSVGGNTGDDGYNGGKIKALKYNGYNG